MSHRATLSRTSLFTALAVVAALSGCASVSLEQSLDRVNTEAADFTGGQVALAQTREEQDQRANTSARLLSQPLGQKEAAGPYQRFVEDFLALAVCRRPEEGRRCLLCQGAFSSR